LTTVGVVALAALALVSAAISAYLTARQRRLLHEAAERERERQRLADQLITAEQDERRRLALFLHDGPVQSLSGIALLLDGVDHAIGTGQTEQAQTVLRSALERHRETIRELRDLSFNLEPVVLRDQGFAMAIGALAEQLGLANKVQIDVDVERAEALSAQTQAALYQIIREALNGAIRRGPPSRVSVRVDSTADGGLETIVSDDAPGERRRATFDALEERTRTLNGRFFVDAPKAGGTTVRVVLPPYVAG
jgi:signal transduction histidine kinase